MPALEAEPTPTFPMYDDNPDITMDKCREMTKKPTRLASMDVQPKGLAMLKEIVDAL